MRPDNMPRPHLPEHSEPRTDTETLIKAGHILARDIQSDDGVANAAIAEMADRLAELRAEIARLTQSEIESDQLRDRLSKLLEDVANAIKGAPKPLHLHSWHDLPELCAAMKAERDELRRRIDSAPRAYGSEILVDGLDNDALFALVEVGRREGDETIRETPEVAALRARVAELEAMVGWRAIADEPAPRDGSWVAMACADDAEPYIEVGHWSRWESMPEYVHIGGGLYRREPVFREDWSGINNAHRATHWMPVRLPTPPEPSP